MKDPPLVSIITVNYNQSAVTCEMLLSLYKISYPKFEVIVLDNGSRNDNPSMIKQKFPQVNFIKNSENLGFAGANNLGISISKGKYFLLLNNDTEVDPGFLEPLVKKIESDPLIAAVSPKIRYFYKPDIIQYAGLTPINPYTIRSRSIGGAEKDIGLYETDTMTAYAHGAAMMISREVTEKIGLMSTAFFLYYEELDWGFRARKAGFKIYYVHDSLVYHKESVSTGKQSPFKTYYINRSRLLYMRRNVYGYKYIISILFQIFIAVPKNCCYFLLKGKPDLLWAYIRAVFWHLTNMFNKNIYGNPFI